jgi:hypothetical protein
MNAADDALDRCAALASAALGALSGPRADDLALYLAHVERAESLRRLARAAGKAPSSVHRAVRRIEALRDDPLLDRVVDAAGAAARVTHANADPSQETPVHPTADTPQAACSAPELFDLVARRTLERLSEADAFLMVATGAEKAGVFSRRNRFRRPLGLVSLADAAELAARDLVRCTSRTAASAKYAITAAGRAWLKRALAAAQSEGQGGADAAASFAGQHREDGERLVARGDGAIAPIRVNLCESPIAWLARRRGPDGEAFLAPEEVEAGERLREDWEAAQMGPRVAQDWRAFLVPRDGPPRSRGPAEGPSAARDRVGRAMAELGPGLADVALRTCCFVEGLETTERRMGWSARSGKVVLKIALQRLAAHYGIAPSFPHRAA